MITLSSRMTDTLLSVRNPPEFVNAHCDRSTYVTVTAENTFDISRVLKLISDPHTDFMYERHKISLRNLRNANIFGIKIRDLIHYRNILNICAKRVTRLSDVYHQSLIELIKLCGNPFLKNLSSDEVNYFSAAVDFMNHFGYLLRVKNEEISLDVCHALEKFYFMKDALIQIPEEIKERQTSKKFNQNVVCHSDIIESLLLSYHETSETNELSLAIIKLIERLTKHSGRHSVKLKKSKPTEMNSNKIILKSGAKIICDHINLAVSSNDLLSYSISTLWNLIDNITDESIKIEWMKQIGNEDCLIKLRDIFFTLLAQSHSKFCRNLRNDVLTIILLIIKYANVYGQLKQIRIVETGLVKRLVNLLTFDEFRCMNPLFKNLKLLPNDENFDMKKLIISILVEISNDPVAVYVMSDTGLIKGLFQWICPVIQTNSGYLSDEHRQSLRSSTIFSEYYNLNKCNVQSQSQLIMKHEQDQSEDEEEKGAIDKNIPNKENSKLKTTQTDLCNEQTDHDDDGNEHHDGGNTFMKDEKRQNLDVISKWPQAYLEELHLYMLDALATLAPRLLSDCITYGIPPRLMLLLQWCTSSEPFLGQGNSFHGVGGRNNKRAQLRYSLRLIRSLVETNDERIILDFVCHGLVQFLIPLICPISLRLKSERPHDELLRFGGETLRERRRLQNEQNIALANSKVLVDDDNDEEEEDIVGLEMQCDLLLILAKLCDLDAERKQMIGTDGIDAIIQLLKQTSKRLATIESVQYRLLTQSTPIQATSSLSSSLPSMHSIILYREPLFKLAYALTEAVWSCIIGSNDCEDCFLMKNGATYLLNLLEWYPTEAVNYLLGCLVDLTENSKCLPYLSSWSGIRPLNETIDDNTNDESQVQLDHFHTLSHTDTNPLKQQMSHLELTTSLLTKSPDLVVSTKLHKIITTTTSRSTVHDTNTNTNDINNTNDDQTPLSENYEEVSSQICKQDTVNLIDPDESISVWLNGPSLPQLLCYLWRWEEKRRIRQMKEKSIKVDEETKVENERRSDNNCPSSRSGSKCDSLRMNIYALFLRLGFNTHENLTPKDQITLEKIESYLDLKVAEVWIDMQLEFNETDFRPITPDQQMLSCISNWCKKQLDNLQSRQQKILKSSKDAELSDEQNYYSSIRNIIRNHEYAMNSYNDYLARTSNYEYLKQARQKQLSAIDASRIGGQLNKTKQHLDGESSLKSSLESNQDVQKNGLPEREVKHHPHHHHHHHHQHHNHRAEVVIPSNISIHGTESTAYHKTDIDKLNVTAFCSQSVTIDSTPAHLFMHPTKIEEELLKVIELKQSQMTNESDEDDV